MSQFFEASHSSPRKKSKLEVDLDQEEAAEAGPDIDEDSMPGFYEEEENQDMEMHEIGDDDLDVQEPEKPLLNHHFKPHSHKPQSRTGAPTSSRAGPSSEGQPGSPESGSGSTPGLNGEIEKPKSTAPRSKLEQHTCPICGKQLATDNQELNAHIDFCLSKGAIMDAQARASSPEKPRKKPRIFGTTNKKQKS